MKHSTLRIGIITAVFCMFMACKKELSIENGGFGGIAQGELIDSLGNCKSSVVTGEYTVDSSLVISTHYALINVNFTAQGKYKIYTDTVNGMWFLDSGFAVSNGRSTIKLKGYGTPILPRTTYFTIYFNNNVCSFAVSVDGSITGGGGSGGGTGSGDDYFPTTSGSSWTYQYLPKLGSTDTFTVTTITGLIPIDTLSYAQFATSLSDTFYFAKDGKGTYFAYSTVDFDYTFLFDTIPKMFISYPFLKENAPVAETWESGTYGPVWKNGKRGVSKAVFTIASKNGSYTIANKIYPNVINVERKIQFLEDNTSGSYQTLLTGNSYYAKGYGLIDQVIGTQKVSLFRTPTIQ